MLFGMAVTALDRLRLIGVRVTFYGGVTIRAGQTSVNASVLDFLVYVDAVTRRVLQPFVPVAD